MEYFAALHSDKSRLVQPVSRAGKTDLISEKILAHAPNGCHVHYFVPRLMQSGAIDMADSSEYPLRAFDAT